VLFGDPLTIYIISPQPWDGLKVSKHHYANELSQLGHTVFFIEPPGSASGPRLIEIRNSDVPGVRVVAYRTWFPYAIKFHARPLFNRAMRCQAALLKRAIGVPPDLVWDFDNAFQFSDLRVFGAPFSLLHLVDQIAERRVRCAKHADLFVGVSQSMLARIEVGAETRLVIGHGLNRKFASLAQSIVDGTPRVQKSRVDAAIVGNLDHAAIDWTTLSSYISRHPSVMFHFIGPMTPGRGNEPKHAAARAGLEGVHNIKLHGELLSEHLLEIAQSIDIWIICYDRSLDHNGGVNSHKLLEYLGTGAVTVSSRIEALVDTELCLMTRRLDNQDLPDLFSEAVGRIVEYNSEYRRKSRAAYALAHSYEANIRQINDAIKYIPRI
jgi:hypothetical protein